MEGAGVNTKDGKYSSSVNPSTPPGDNTSTTAQDPGSLINDLRLEMKTKFDDLKKRNDKKIEKCHCLINQLRIEQSKLITKIADIEKERYNDKKTLHQFHAELERKSMDEQNKQEELKRLQKKEEDSKEIVERLSRYGDLVAEIMYEQKMEEMIEVTRRPWSALGTFMYAVRNLFNWDGSGRGLEDQVSKNSKAIEGLTNQVSNNVKEVKGLKDQVRKNIKGHYAFKHWELDSLAHKRGIDGDGVLVAVLDTGVLSNHVAFADTHGIKRMVYGRNFMNDGRGEKKYDDISDQSHGTSVAAIIAGNCSSSYLGGVAPRASLVICRVAQTNEGVNEDHVVDALNWIFEHNEVVSGVQNPDHEKKCDLDHGEIFSQKISIINISLIFPDPIKKVEVVIKRLYSQGVLCIAGSGNDSKIKDIGYPARYSEVLSIGAATISGDVSTISSTDEKTIYALGEDVCLARKPPTANEVASLTTSPPSSQTEKSSTASVTGHTPTSGPPPPPPPSLPYMWLDYTEVGSGTSYAAPAVTGLAALLLQMKKQYSSEDTNFGQKIENIIMSKLLAKKHYLGWLLQPQKISKYFKTFNI